MKTWTLTVECYWQRANAKQRARGRTSVLMMKLPNGVQGCIAAVEGHKPIAVGKVFALLPEHQVSPNCKDAAEAKEWCEKILFGKVQP